MVSMPERLTDADFVGQAGLRITVALPITALVPPYAAVGELNPLVSVFGGATDGDAIKLMPHRAECDQYVDLPPTDQTYSECACAGARLSDQGGSMLDSLVPLLTGVRVLGRHIVCHGFAATAFDAAALTDSDYEPQRGLIFEGVNRSSAVSALLPNATLTHFLTTYRIPTRYEGYLRFVRFPGGEAALEADSAGDVCSDAAALVRDAPGGALSAGEVERRIVVQLDMSGVYGVCHAFRTLTGDGISESDEQFTLQQGVSLRVTYAIEAISPTSLLLNERVVVSLPGAMPGDFIKLMLNRATGCAGAVASADGGMVTTANMLVMRPVDPYLLASSAEYVVCHAFNYTDGLSDAVYHTQAGLAATVSYPLQSVRALDLYGRVVRPTARKRLALRLPDALANRASAGDAIVILPASAGACNGAAALHYTAVCTEGDTGDMTAASALEPPSDATVDGDGGPGIETRHMRLPPGLHVICHAFTADLFEGAAGMLEPLLPGTPAPSPPPPIDNVRCPDASAYLATDVSFRTQYGVNLDIEYPMTAIAPAAVTVGHSSRVDVVGGVTRDMLRLVPACELGCGLATDDGDFPFRVLIPDPAVLATLPPPPPYAPNPPIAPAEAAAPAAPPTPYTGAVTLSVSTLPAALYKGCYAYREDFLEGTSADGDPTGAFWPQMQFVVEVPLVADTTALVVSRPNDVEAVTIQHERPVSVDMDRGDWRWVRLSTMCDPTENDIPIPGCRPGTQLQAALEMDSAFNRAMLRYHSMHALFAHTQVIQPPIRSTLSSADASVQASSVIVSARTCFDGLDETRLRNLAAGYLQRPGAGLLEPEVHGVSQRLGIDRATFHVGTNVSSGGCNALPTSEAWLRLRCAAADLPDGVPCSARVRAVVLPLAIRPGTEMTIDVPLEPGATDGASRLLFTVDLGDADILSFTLIGEPIGCSGASSALAFPNNESAFFRGSMLVHRERCPSAALGMDSNGHLPGYNLQLPADGAGNATAQFFCTDEPGTYHVLIDAADQPLHTEGPPARADDGEPTGSYEGAPLADGMCPIGWFDLVAGLTSNTSLAGSAITAADVPHTWQEGSRPNVLRRGRLHVRLRIYRSEPFATDAYADGERREACLSYEQTRTFRIFTASAHNATLFVFADRPISAIYARRDAMPDVTQGMHDASTAIGIAPRWGCADAQCTRVRTRFALTASTCAPEASGYWYVSLRLNSLRATIAESVAASSAVPALLTDSGRAAITSLTSAGAASLTAAEASPLLDALPLAVRPSRFYLSMVLYGADVVPVPSAVPPAYALPLAASPDAAAALGVADGAGFIGGASMIHLRLQGIERTAAPEVDVAMAHGTVRALYLQRDRCAAKASGLAADGLGESDGCGLTNLADCKVAWLSRFSAYAQTKIYKSSAVVTGTALNIFEAEGLPPTDWWIGVEANDDDASDITLRVGLVGAVTRVAKRCYFSRFCPNYDDPTSRFAVGTRDADDPAIELERVRTLYGYASERMDDMTAFARRNNIYWPMYAAFSGTMFIIGVWFVIYAVNKARHGYVCVRPMLGDGAGHVMA